MLALRPLPIPSLELFQASSYFFHFISSFIFCVLAHLSSSFSFSRMRLLACISAKQLVSFIASSWLHHNDSWSHSTSKPFSQFSLRISPPCLTLRWLVSNILMCGLPGVVLARNSCYSDATISYVSGVACPAWYRQLWIWPQQLLTRPPSLPLPPFPLQTILSLCSASTFPFLRNSLV